eukprot:6472237-Amphidinium_carterae.2
MDLVKKICIEREEQPNVWKQAEGRKLEELTTTAQTLCGNLEQICLLLGVVAPPPTSRAQVQQACASFIGSQATSRHYSSSSSSSSQV